MLLLTLPILATAKFFPAVVWSLCREPKTTEKVWLIVRTFSKFSGSVPNTCLMTCLLWHSRSYTP